MSFYIIKKIKDGENLKSSVSLGSKKYKSHPVHDRRLIHHDNRLLVDFLNVIDQLVSHLHRK